ncbi:MAG: dihydroneopterin aldolase [Sedimentisphaerales bacterium]|nr:dihydroneopterin aldolase [Sedimentisphaerales bacterium]
MADPLDAIHIRDLQFRCIIGVNDDERREKQDVLVNLTLYADLRAAGRSDRIEDTVDYKSVKKAILAMGETSQFFLIERLAECIAEICLGFAHVARVRVCVEKPSALRFARSVGVDIIRP